MRDVRDSDHNNANFGVIRTIYEQRERSAVQSIFVSQVPTGLLIVAIAMVVLIKQR